MIDSDGYRPNVAIVLMNADGRLFWARRIGQDAWQFPQGGIRKGESPEEALYRELHEEIGLYPNDVKLLGRTDNWLHYDLPDHLIRKHQQPVCIGQKQIWFLLQLTANENAIKLDCTTHPEFDDWLWVEYNHPQTDVVDFKRNVYKKALSKLAEFIPEKQQKKTG